MMRSRFSPLMEFSDLMEFVWRFKPTISRHVHGRVLLGMEPDMKTYTITMPSVAVFIFGTALCCYCCFKYGLQRWYERTLLKTRTKTRSGITYAASLQYKKEQLEHALRKVTKLRKIEPTRSDLKYEAVALKEGIRMLHEHLRNSERYTDYCEGMKRPSLDSLINKRSTMDAQGNSFVNPLFSSQQAINSGYMIDPVKKSGGEAGSPTSSEEECHNPKHKELELYLMSTGGAILPSMLKYPGSSTASPSRGFPGVSAPGSRMTSPLGRQEMDGEGRSLSVSPVQQGKPREGPQNGQAFGNRIQNPTQPNTQDVQSPPGMPPNRQQPSPVQSPPGMPPNRQQPSPVQSPPGMPPNRQQPSPVQSPPGMPPNRQQPSPVQSPPGMPSNRQQPSPVQSPPGMPPNWQQPSPVQSPPGMPPNWQQPSPTRSPPGMLPNWQQPSPTQSPPGMSQNRSPIVNQNFGSTSRLEV